MTILLVTGSRKITDRRAVEAVLNEAHSRLGFTIVIEGEAAGPDEFSRDWAISQGINVMECPVTAEDWELRPNYAGNLRNAQMLESAREEQRQSGGVEIVVIAFWDGESSGTKHMINICRKAGFVPKVHLMGSSKSKRLF